MIERFDPLKGERLQILDEAGAARPGLEPVLPAETLRTTSARRALTRTADARAPKLHPEVRP